MILLAAAITAILIAVNALYVAAEFAAVSVRRTKLRLRAAAGDRLARIALQQIDEPQRLDDYVAACQVGITLSSLALGAVGQAQVAPLVTPWFASFGGGAAAAQSTAAVVVLVTLTALQMVVGELVPKSLALHDPTTAVRWAALPMLVSSRLLAGFVRVLNGSGRAILRLLGHRPSGHAHVHSPEEIELLVAESGEGGALEERDTRRLRRALRLRQRKARHLMTPRTRIRALDAALPLDELVGEVLGGSYTRYPVYSGERENVVGIVHSRDVAARVLAAGGVGSLDEVLRPAVAVPETMAADDLLRLIRAQNAFQVVVLDEFGGLAGIVSASDVLREVLGDVPDDFGGAPLVPEELPDGRVRLPGRLPIDRAARRSGMDWDGVADTVAGAVLETAGGVPKAGDRLQLGGIEIEVERVEGRAVVSVIATRRVAGDEEGEPADG